MGATPLNGFPYEHLPLRSDRSYALAPLTAFSNVPGSKRGFYYPTSARPLRSAATTTLWSFLSAVHAIPSPVLLRDGPAPLVTSFATGNLPTTSPPVRTESPYGLAACPLLW